ncbi:MAG: glycosyltransferase family 4 protein [Lysobacter sp.]
MPEQQPKSFPNPAGSDEHQREAGAADGTTLLAPHPELWREFLWIRDQMRGRRHVLVMGHAVSALAVLLVREGVRVTALDSDDRDVTEAGRAVASEGSDNGEPHILTHLDPAAVEEALAAATYDGAIITAGCRMNLQHVLEALPSALTHRSRLVLTVPFGVQAAGSTEVAFPRSVIDHLAGCAVDQLEVAGGLIRAVLTCNAGSQKDAPSTAALLELTEAGAAEELSRLLGRTAALESELDDTRAKFTEAECQIRELKESTSFQLGLSLALALRSPVRLLKLPVTWVHILSGRHRRGAASAGSSARTGLTEWQKEGLRNRARQAMEEGADAVVRVVDENQPDAEPSLLAFSYLVAAQACGAAGRHEIEFVVATRALELNRSVGMLRGFLHVALRCREMQAASDTLRELHDAARLGNRIAEEFLRNFSKTSSYKIAVLEAIPPRPERRTPVEGGRFAYVLHNSLPYSSGGYATRSHGVAVGLLERGYPIVCLTRPGFPLDMKPDLAPIDVPAVDIIDGVPYQRIGEPRRSGIPEYEYVLASADRMEEELRRLNPAYVQAASNYVTALPALVAARRLGVPFFYEVRGLWEITRMSRDQDFAESISFDVQRHIEGTLAREADHVFTLTEPMREELIERGVEPQRITLLPNSVNADRFQPLVRDRQLAARLAVPDGVPVIGYVGTFVIYEGLEHLAEACVRLHEKGHDFRLLLVGNENASGQDRGPITEEILRIAREGGIESKLILAGRIPHEQVEAYYSLIDICPFPRKPWPVCEMVSPMKPLEALAMEKAVVVSSVRALTEMITDGVTGAVFEKGNVSSLAHAIESLMADPDRRARLGKAGREWVVRERAWTQIADKIEVVVKQFDESMTVPMDELSPSTSGRNGSPA